MSEQEPQPRAQELEYVDVTYILQSDSFKEAVSRVEERLKQSEDEDEIAQHARALAELFGDNYEDGICNIAAGAYRRQEDGVLAADPEVLNETGYIYNGLAIESIDGALRVLIELEDIEGKMAYSVLPAALLQFEISENKVSEGINAILEMHIENARQLLSHETFLQASYEDQQGMIGAVTDCIEQDLVLACGGDIAIVESNEYYCISDTITKVDLVSTFKARSQNDKQPAGKMIGVSFLEQLEAREFDYQIDNPLPYHSFDEFSKSRGVPCIILRDAIFSKTYFIQLDKVDDIICDGWHDHSDEDDSTKED